MARIIPLAIIILAVLASLASASVPSFCKCTCFQNSTIIPLGPQNGKPPAPAKQPPSSSSASSPSSASPESTSTPATNLNPNLNLHRDRSTAHPNADAEAQPLLVPRESSSSCAQCNRAFCLSYNLPICKGAEDKDVRTACFQRDSHKDRVIVWGFILGTAGLLGWAGVRRVAALESSRGRASPAAGAPGGGRMSVSGQVPGLGLEQQGGGAAAGRRGGFLGIGGGGGGSGSGDGGAGRNARGPGFFGRTASVAGGGVDRGLYSPLGNDHDADPTRGHG